MLDKIQNNYLLKLLFDYRGHIHKKEYLIGQLVLLLLLMVSVLFVTHEAFFWIPGTVFNSSPYAVKEFVDGVLPYCYFLIPIYFYISFTLTSKRSEALGLSKIVSYILSLILFSFYFACAKTLFLYWHVAKYMDALSASVSNILFIFLTLGFIVILCLYFLQAEIDKNPNFKYGDENQVKYLFFLFLLHGTTSTVSWFCYTNVIERPPMLEALASIPLVIETSCFLYLMFKRITNIQYPLSIFFGLLAFAFVFQVGIVWIKPELFYVTKYDGRYLMNAFDGTTYIFLFVFLSVSFLFFPSLENRVESKK